MAKALQDNVVIPIQHVQDDSNDSHHIIHIETDESKTADNSLEISSSDQSNEVNPIKMALVWMSRVGPIFAVFFAIGYIVYLLTNSENWEYGGDDSDGGAAIRRREANRGVFVSILIALLLNAVGAFMFYIKVHEGLVVTNYGFILGPVIGYLLDQGIGTDDGFENAFTIDGIAFTFASLVNANFVRYIITVFLDLFISNPLQDVLKRQALKIGVIDVLTDETNKADLLRKLDLFIAMNYPSILQSIIGFITFNAYTNQTRFSWAYPSASLDRDLRIPPGTIMLSTAIAGVLYLNFYTIMDYISEREYFDVNTKLVYVLIVLALLYGLNQTEMIEAPVEGEEDDSYTDSIKEAKPYLGFLMFIGFVVYGFVYPIWTRLGCCGICCAENDFEEEGDHMMDMNAKEDANIRGLLMKHIRRGVRTEMQAEKRRVSCGNPNQIKSKEISF